MIFKDMKRQELIIKEVRRAVREYIGVEAESVGLIRGVVAKDWVVLEYEARTKFATLRPHVIFTKGNPRRSLRGSVRVCGGETR